MAFLCLESESIALQDGHVFPCANTHFFHMAMVIKAPFISRNRKTKAYGNTKHVIILTLIFYIPFTIFFLQFNGVLFFEGFF